ncbi:hypothetical protein COO60DRAFT_857537 [Scenedesmus sp. NREL 46B-D3]|nr:hypothetical protein COO60DRAFT_857537 [Scenedesmus sp. NREL 46B-D3]
MRFLRVRLLLAATSRQLELPTPAACAAARPTTAESADSTAGTLTSPVVGTKAHATEERLGKHPHIPTMIALVHTHSIHIHRYTSHRVELHTP